MSDKDLLTVLLDESLSYSKIEDIEKLVESRADLSSVPIQPLYLALRLTSLDQVAEILPKLSKDQRQALLDIDIWSRDSVDIESFDFWNVVYNLTEERKIKEEFVNNEQFLLFLKGRFTISTYDLEQPRDIPHENFFLTDDNAFLFEYGDDFEHGNEIQTLIRVLYADLGIEKTFSLFMTLISDTFSVFQENEYKFKRERLKDYGFVDYFDALDFIGIFRSLSSIDSFIRNKSVTTGTIDEIGQGQSLHSTALTPYQAGMEDLSLELGKLKDQKRKDYIHFNFLRMVNGTLSLANALKEGSIGIHRVGSQTKDLIKLGFSYISNRIQQDEIMDEPKFEEGMFAVFELIDLYRIGNSLVQLGKKDLKKTLEKHGIEDDANYESFLGTYWNTLIGNTFSEELRFRDLGSNKLIPVDRLDIYDRWKKDIDLCNSMMPYMGRFFQAYKSLIDEGLIQDKFFLNYSVDEIDFEAVLISSFINYAIGNYDQGDRSRMGLSISELRKFLDKYMQLKEEHFVFRNEAESSFDSAISQFTDKFGFKDLARFPEYLTMLLDDHLVGYEFHKLSDQEFKHVGGPILLATETDGKS